LKPENEISVLTSLLEVEKLPKNNKLIQEHFIVYCFSFIRKGTPETELPRRKSTEKAKKSNVQKFPNLTKYTIRSRYNNELESTKKQSVKER